MFTVMFQIALIGRNLFANITNISGIDGHGSVSSMPAAERERTELNTTKAQVH